MRTTVEVTDTPPDLSVLFLVSEHPGPLAELYREYVLPLQAMGHSLECVFAVEPGHRHRTDQIQQAADSAVPIRVLVAAHSMGETGLVRMALPHCRAPALLILAAYRRVEPAALPGLIRMLEEADLVVARRWPRKDSWVNRLQSRLFHLLVGRFTHSHFRDMASGVRAVRRELLEELQLYGDLYRFLPVLALRDGYRVREVDCAQHPDDSHTRVYNPTVYLRRAIDILGLYFLVRFTEKPLRFFGLVGGILSILGAGLLVFLFVERLSGEGVANRPLLLFGVLLLVLGVQAVALGLVGEIVVHGHAGRQRRYRLARPDSSE